MADCFALFSVARRPWLDAEELKNRFHAMAATQHPDVELATGSDNFSALNTAYATLRDPARRLRHLLELESPEVLSDAPPIAPDLTDCFMIIAEQRGAIRALRQRKSNAGSRLANALLADDKAKIERRLRAARDRLEDEHARALDDLREIDAAWPLRNVEIFTRAAELQRRLAYLGRWLADVREALLEVTIPD